MIIEFQMPEKNLHKRVIVWVVAMANLLLLFCLVFPAEAKEPIRISNQFLQVGVNAKDGSMLELIDFQTKQNQIAGAENKFPIWEIDIVSGTNRSRLSP